MLWYCRSITKNDGTDNSKREFEVHDCARIGEKWWTFDLDLLKCRAEGVADDVER